MFEKIPCTRVDGDSRETGVHEVVQEVPVAVFVNGMHLMTAVTSPGRYEEYVTGYLFTEQVIRTPADIESIRVEQNRISVLTTNPFTVTGPKKTILSGCGGSTSYIDIKKLPKINSDILIPAGNLPAGLKKVLNSELHRITGGIHIVALFSGEDVVTVSEDIGRHNALDRVIGFGLTHGVDFSQTWIAVSGRISSEMARKCLVANIPVIVSRGATTTLAVEIGEKAGLTIVGFLRVGKMVIYTHPERIGTSGAGYARG